MSESTGFAFKNGILLFLIILVVHVILKNAVTERAVNECMEQQLEQRRKARSPPSSPEVKEGGGGAGGEEEATEQQGPEETAADGKQEEEDADDDDLFRYVTDMEGEKDASSSSSPPPPGPAMTRVPANIALGGGLSLPPVPSTAAPPPWQDEMSEPNPAGGGELRGLDSFEQFNFAPLSTDVQSLRPPGIPRLG